MLKDTNSLDGARIVLGRGHGRIRGHSNCKVLIKNTATHAFINVFPPEKGGWGAGGGDTLGIGPTKNITSRGNLTANLGTGP